MAEEDSGTNEMGINGRALVGLSVEQVRALPDIRRYMRKYRDYWLALPKEDSAAGAGSPYIIADIGPEPSEIIERMRKNRASVSLFRFVKLEDALKANYV